MRRMFYRIAVIVLMCIGAMQGYQMQIPAGETIDGIVTYVIDGDTMRVNGIKVRLWGVDAPEQDMDYYHDATAFLTRHVAYKRVSCLVRDKDRYDRVVAQCKRTHDDADLGALLVTDGWARDYTRHSRRYYLPQQIAAQKSRKGIWQK